MSIHCRWRDHTVSKSIEVNLNSRRKNGGTRILLRLEEDDISGFEFPPGPGPGFVDAGSCYCKAAAMAIVVIREWKEDEPETEYSVGC